MELHRRRVTCEPRHCSTSTRSSKPPRPRRRRVRQPRPSGRRSGRSNWSNDGNGRRRGIGYGISGSRQCSTLPTPIAGHDPARPGQGGGPPDPGYWYAGRRPLSCTSLASRGLLVCTANSLAHTLTQFTYYSNLYAVVPTAAVPAFFLTILLVSNLPTRAHPHRHKISTGRLRGDLPPGLANGKYGNGGGLTAIGRVHWSLVHSSHPQPWLFLEYECHSARNCTPCMQLAAWLYCLCADCGIREGDLGGFEQFSVHCNDRIGVAGDMGSCGVLRDGVLTTGRQAAR